MPKSSPNQNAKIIFSVPESIIEQRENEGPPADACCAIQLALKQLQIKKIDELELMYKGSPGRRKTGKQSREKRDTIRWADTENIVTVIAKAPDYVAGHWVVEAKRTRVSMSYVINKAIIEAFGVPEGSIADVDNEEDN